MLTIIHLISDFLLFSFLLEACFTGISTLVFKTVLFHVIPEGCLSMVSSFASTSTTSFIIEASAPFLAGTSFAFGVISNGSLSMLILLSLLFVWRVSNLRSVSLFLLWKSILHVVTALSVTFFWNDINKRY